VPADAENLPFDDGSFDVVSSAFGVIFAPDHDAAARELARVTRYGGRLGLTAIAARSSGGATWRILWKYVPLPAGAGDPLAWGEEEYVRSLLGPAYELEYELVQTPPPEPRPLEEIWSFMAKSFGPLKSALDSLPPERAADLRAEFLARIEESQGQPRSYALVTGTRR
jgi:SAM-dependent methyltransferase